MPCDACALPPCCRRRVRENDRVRTAGPSPGRGPAARCGRPRRLLARRQSIERECPPPFGPRTATETFGRLDGLRANATFRRRALLKLLEVRFAPGRRTCRDQEARTGSCRAQLASVAAPRAETCSVRDAVRLGPGQCALASDPESLDALCRPPLVAKERSTHVRVLRYCMGLRRVALLRNDRTPWDRLWCGLRKPRARLPCRCREEEGRLQAATEVVAHAVRRSV